ncbi:hypothetical protein ABH927_002562 [Planotetraspora sp. GP83]
MVMRLLIETKQPASLQLKVAPIASALAGLFFVKNSNNRSGVGHDSASHVHVTRCRPRPAAARPCPATRAVRAHTWETRARLRDVLEADLRYRMSRLANGGLPLLLSDLNPGIRLDGSTLLVDTMCDSEHSTSTSNLILMPAVLRDRVIVLLTEAQPRTAVLFYPVSGMPTARPSAGPYVSSLHDLARLAPPADRYVVGHLASALVGPRCGSCS